VQPRRRLLWARQVVEPADQALEPLGRPAGQCAADRGDPPERLEAAARVELGPRRDPPLRFLSPTAPV